MRACRRSRTSRDRAAGRRQDRQRAPRGSGPPPGGGRAPRARRRARPARWRRRGGAAPRPPGSRRAPGGTRARRRRSALRRARRWRARGRGRRYQRSVDSWRASACAGVLGDGCLRAGIVPSGPENVAAALVRIVPALLRARGDPDVGDGLRAGGAQVPARGFGVGVSYGRLREACQTSVDGTSIDTLETLAAEPGARRRAGDDAGRSPAAPRGRGAARDRRRAAAVGADPLRGRLAGARSPACR